MLREFKVNKNRKYEFANIDNLVSRGHVLRKKDEYIDFSFIDEIVKEYNCLDNGRSAVLPVIL